MMMMITVMKIVVVMMMIMMMMMVWSPLRPSPQQELVLLHQRLHGAVNEIRQGFSSLCKGLKLLLAPEIMTCNLTSSATRLYRHLLATAVKSPLIQPALIIISDHLDTSQTLLKISTIPVRFTCSLQGVAKACW